MEGLSRRLKGIHFLYLAKIWSKKSKMDLMENRAPESAKEDNQSRLSGGDVEGRPKKAKSANSVPNVYQNRQKKIGVT